MQKRDYENRIYKLPRLNRLSELLNNYPSLTDSMEQEKRELIQNSAYALEICLKNQRINFDSLNQQQIDDIARSLIVLEQAQHCNNLSVGISYQVANKLDDATSSLNNIKKLDFTEFKDRLLEVIKEQYAYCLGVSESSFNRNINELNGARYYKPIKNREELLNNISDMGSKFGLMHADFADIEPKSATMLDIGLGKVALELRGFVARVKYGIANAAGAISPGESSR